MNRATIMNFLKQHPSVWLAGFLICAGLTSNELFISHGLKRIPILMYFLWLLGLRAFAPNPYKKYIFSIADLTIIGIALAHLIMSGFDILSFVYFVIFSIHLVYLYLPEKYKK